MLYLEKLKYFRGLFAISRNLLYTERVKNKNQQIQVVEFDQ